MYVIYAGEFIPARPWFSAVWARAWCVSRFIILQRRGWRRFSTLIAIYPHHWRQMLQICYSISRRRVGAHKKGLCLEIPASRLRYTAPLKCWARERSVQINYDEPDPQEFIKLCTPTNGGWGCWIFEENCRLEMAKVPLLSGDMDELGPRKRVLVCRQRPQIRKIEICFCVRFFPGRSMREAAKVWLVFNFGVASWRSYN